jgi:hypothetical protein
MGWRRQLCEQLYETLFDQTVDQLPFGELVRLQLDDMKVFCIRGDGVLFFKVYDPAEHYGELADKTGLIEVNMAIDEYKRIMATFANDC